jgi:hypothetical protein
MFEILSQAIDLNDNITKFSGPINNFPIQAFLAVLDVFSNDSLVRLTILYNLLQVIAIGFKAILQDLFYDYSVFEFLNVQFVIWLFIFR